MDITIIIVMAILFSAFFSGMEIAYVSQNRMQIEIERKKTNLFSKMYIYLCDRPNKFITTMLLGNTLSLVVYGYFMGAIVTQFLIETFHLPNNALTLLIQTIITTLIILVTAEFMPKAIFSLHAFKLFRNFTLPAFIIYWLLSPLTWIASQFTSLFLKIFKVDNNEAEPIYLKEELSYFISERLEEINDEEVDSEIQIFQNALNFSEVKARDCLIPRNEINAVEFNESIEIVKKRFVESGYSKLIVFKENIDNIIGYIHSFDMFKMPDSIKSIILPIENVYETTSAREIMNQLIKKRKSIAIVLDEYGGTAGMLTLEDIVEELFGEIEDEHDSPLYIEEQISPTQFRFSARLEIDDLNEKYDLYLPENDAYETLGGMIVFYHGDIPQQNEEIDVKNYRFFIQEASATKIETVGLTILED